MRPADLVLLLALVLATGCVGSGAEEIDDFPCPEESELTFENFGGEFFGTYCQECHASDSDDRNGAPGGFTFDTEDDIEAHRARIFARAAASNTSMPPGPDDPPEEERMLLAEYLACGGR